jgi:hypothetical protein
MSIEVFVWVNVCVGVVCLGNVVVYKCVLVTCTVATSGATLISHHSIQYSLMAEPCVSEGAEKVTFTLELLSRTDTASEAGNELRRTDP